MKVLHPVYFRSGFAFFTKYGSKSVRRLPAKYLRTCRLVTGRSMESLLCKISRVVWELDPDLRHEYSSREDVNNYAKACLNKREFDDWGRRLRYIFFNQFQSHNNLSRIESRIRGNNKKYTKRCCNNLLVSNSRSFCRVSGSTLRNASRLFVFTFGTSFMAEKE